MLKRCTIANYCVKGDNSACFLIWENINDSSFFPSDFVFEMENWQKWINYIIIMRNKWINYIIIIRNSFARVYADMCQFLFKVSYLSKTNVKLCFLICSLWFRHCTVAIHIHFHLFNSFHSNVSCLTTVTLLLVCRVVVVMIFQL